MPKSKEAEAANQLPPYPVPQTLYIPRPCYIDHEKRITHLLTHQSATDAYLEVAHDLQHEKWHESRVFTIQPNSMISTIEAGFLYAFGRKSLPAVSNSKSQQDDTLVVGGQEEKTPTSIGTHESLFFEDGTFLNPFRSEYTRYCWKKPRGIFASDDVVLEMWEENDSKASKQIIAGFSFEFKFGGKLSAKPKTANGEEAWRSVEELAFIVGTAFVAVMKQESKLSKFDSLLKIGMITSGGGGDYTF
ncbi:hypothetical protein HK100_001478 [Physocladia obscura]|uniref:Uncharacterized protein n=1 Tax=Physocladia obscura TaxID=109957 RepID=A0AAD5T976_9FUNG|nr:hypothetical protein HK100_001478 [Physocladia obscura]